MDIRVALVVPWYGEDMGYLENRLPPHLVAQGVEVAVMTSYMKPYLHDSEAPAAQRSWKAQRVEVTPMNGFEVRRHPSRIVRGDVVLRGLGASLAEFRPDVVQCLDPSSLLSLQAATLAIRQGFKLFTGAHQARMDYPQENSDRSGYLLRVRRWLTGPGMSWVIGRISHGCFAISKDAAEAVVQYCRLPEHSVIVSPLGVDTALFHPVSTPEEAESRALLRSDLGFSEADTVFVNSGQLTEDKGLLDLAKAVSRLVGEGVRVKGLAIGNGPIAEKLSTMDGMTVLPAVAWQDLAQFYRCADVAIWPRRYSISQLDAAACGLPLILSDALDAPERTEDIAITCAVGDVDALERAMLHLTNPETRAQMGSIAAKRISKEFGWESRAAERLTHYRRVL